MEPEILATPSDLPVRTSGWSAPADHPARDTHAMDVTPTGATGAAHATVAPWSGGSAPTAHVSFAPSDFGNVHARPRAHAHVATWSTATRTAAPAIPFETPQPQGLYLRWGKRALDIALSLLALIATAPVMLVLAVMIKLESRGPVVYKSTRIGRGGRAFTFWKLRSMVADADLRRHQLKHLNEADGPVFKIARDPRVTRVGRFLRTTSLDEIPQFINVLRGDMSLVGPRPPIPEEVAQYEPWQLRRLDVRPGITCLWQISGRSRLGFQEWMRLDLEYIRHRSLLLDLKILVRTIPAVLSREGAY